MILLLVSDVKSRKLVSYFKVLLVEQQQFRHTGGDNDEVIQFINITKVFYQSINLFLIA